MADELHVTECDLDTSVPDWVIDHPQTLSVFREFGIDDSCGGKSLEYVCDQQGIDGNLVLKMLRRKLTTPATETRGEIDGDSPCESR
jgi:iron-sulfur cluster repair protein YtfE (RIC family)